MTRNRFGLAMLLAGGYLLWWKRRMIVGIATGEGTTTTIDSLIYHLENGPTGYAFLNDPGPLDERERQEWINALHETKIMMQQMGAPLDEPYNHLLDDFWIRIDRVMIIDTDMGLKIDYEASRK